MINVNTKNLLSNMRNDKKQSGDKVPGNISILKGRFKIDPHSRYANYPPDTDRLPLRSKANIFLTDLYRYFHT